MGRLVGPLVQEVSPEKLSMETWEGSWTEPELLAYDWQLEGRRGFWREYKVYGWVGSEYPAC